MGLMKRYLEPNYRDEAKRRGFLTASVKQETPKGGWKPLPKVLKPVVPGETLALINVSLDQVEADAKKDIFAEKERRMGISVALHATGRKIKGYEIFHLEHRELRPMGETSRKYSAEKRRRN